MSEQSTPSGSCTTETNSRRRRPSPSTSSAQTTSDRCSLPIDPLKVFRYVPLGKTFDSAMLRKVRATPGPTFIPGWGTVINPGVFDKTTGVLKRIVLMAHEMKASELAIEFFMRAYPETQDPAYATSADGEGVAGRDTSEGGSTDTRTSS